MGCSRPVLIIALLAACESAFMILAPFAAVSHRCGGSLCRLFPPRAIQYCVALIVAVQFGLIPFAESIDSISPAFGLYIFVGFNKFFALGHIMLKARAEPLLSKAWPLVFVFLVLLSPSSNWVLAGNLTYPYFERWLDRVTYVSFALVVMFVIDRVGHTFSNCIEAPAAVNLTSLAMYLLHPVIITCLVRV